MSFHRLFLHNHDHAAVARWLRRQAMMGFQRGDDDYSRDYVDSCTCGVNLPEYPKTTSLIFTRDSNPDCRIGWHLSICCVTDRGYRGYDAAEGAYWVGILFGFYADLAVEQPLCDRSSFGNEKDVRHFMVECDWGDTSDVVTLKGL